MFIQILFAVLATFGFGIIFNIRREKLIFSALVGGISWGTYLFCLELSTSIILAYFASSVVLTICSEIFARLLKTPVTSILISGLIPLVPGSGIYYTMFYILEKNMEQAIYKGTETLFIAVALSFGIVVVSSLVRIIKTGQTNRYSRNIS
ncbi:MULTISPECIES: threonine/serine exporter family protein [Psychrilyobacter]|uniref:Threonine/serine exporter n=1 Tax=Psychrilyobacter piezotolerans TaxID=2293438 RepID=A0ABX9KM72_9FUSO|nr:MULTISPECIES: threonine/serine exporter family protein [Psychrilyobacter]MCS5423074.1 threonine/serine exporter family protein [Psychrilyobacter sp. S5]NDI76439.1 threonine/serine exporter [Psychrilyobacter piezotolerans]RDE66035.1 threonine/serine exporter [Psychrilyobacter sp. S5]REI43213.1 threonine/serine exporter [Psychrilyobacter piezotolerans]